MARFLQRGNSDYELSDDEESRWEESVAELDPQERKEKLRDYEKLQKKKKEIMIEVEKINNGDDEQKQKQSRKQLKYLLRQEGEFKQMCYFDVDDGRDARPRLIQTLKALQSYDKAAELLESMVIIVGDHDTFLGFPSLLLRPASRTVLPLQVLTKESDVPQIEEEVDNIEAILQGHWKEQSRCNLFKMCIACTFGGDKLQGHGVAYSWCPLFEHRIPAKERFYILQALNDVDRSECVFTTFAGAYFEEASWQKVKWQFWIFSILCDFITLLMFFEVGFCLRQKVQPQPLVMYTIYFFSVKTVVKIFGEIGMHMYWYRGCAKGFIMYFTGWNPAFLAAEVFTCVVFIDVWRKISYGGECDWSIDGVYDKNFGDEHYCWFLAHPIYLTIVVFTKWIYFINCLMCFRKFGEQVYCSWASLISPPSVWFVLFYFLCVVACFCSYYMFPIGENITRWEGKGKPSIFANGWDPYNVLAKILNPGTILTFMKTFRLNFMGDFDLWELEGVDAVANAKQDMDFSSPSLNFSEGSSIMEIDDGDPNKLFHRGIQIFFMLSAVLFNVMFLNVYIGLLGVIYGELYTKRNQIFAEFRSSFCVKELIWRYLLWERKCQQGDEYDEVGEQAFLLAYTTRAKFAATYSHIDFNELAQGQT